MVNNPIVQTIYSNLHEYLLKEDIKVQIDLHCYKYIININCFTVEIYYNFVDNFYKITFERVRNNVIDINILLTKSKAYKKEVSKIIKQYKKKKNKFESHIFAISQLIKKELDEKGNLDNFVQYYVADLPFDGFFV